MRSRLLLPLLIMQISLMIMATSSHTYISDEWGKHENMLKHYAGCSLEWKPYSSGAFNADELFCGLEKQGALYQNGQGSWTAYAYGVGGSTFATKQAAKGYVDSQLAYWLRPKAEWWKFWKEFKD